MEDQAGGDDEHTFTASQGEGVFLRLVDVEGGPLTPAFTIYGPSGAAVISASSANVASASFSAAVTGTYTVVVYDVSSGLSATGDYRLYFTRAPGASAGGALAPGGAAFGHLDEGAIDSYTFFAIAGDRVALQLTTSPRVRWSPRSRCTAPPAASWSTRSAPVSRPHRSPSR